MELLEPRARKFNNVPQDRIVVLLNKKNCEESSSSKSHYLTSQGSRNYVQWRTKRVAKLGNCTIKLSNDGKTFHPIIPHGYKNSLFPCGRKIGYESVVIKLPKNLVTDDGFIIMQFEMHTHMGIITQCSDMIV